MPNHARSKAEFGAQARTINEALAGDCRHGLMEKRLGVDVPVSKWNCYGCTAEVVTGLIEAARSQARASEETLRRERDENTRKWHLLIADWWNECDPELMPEELSKRIEEALATGCAPDCGSCERSITAERERDEARKALRELLDDRECSFYAGGCEIAMARKEAARRALGEHPHAEKEPCDCGLALQEHKTYCATRAEEKR